VTTSAVVGVIIVLVLAGIGVGGWMLSHHKASSPSPPRHSQRPSTAPAPAAVLKPVSATASDNPAKAGLAIDSNPGTFWYSQYYLDNPVFGGLKTGIGMVLDMGRRVKVSQIQMQLGPDPGANVQIKVSNLPAPPSPAGAAALPTVARASGISGWHMFKIRKPVAGRDIVIWFTKLPPQPGTANHYQANVYNVSVRGTD
jgi:hypothetical protein